MASLAATRRVREFGIRLVLGASGRDRLGRELGRTLAIAFAGLACGVVASMALARAVAGFLYGVTVWSPEAYGAAIVVLIVPALVAAWLPARRAAHVDPASALRHD
jgi:putative ABC transport system permease protein